MLGRDLKVLLKHRYRKLKMPFVQKLKVEDELATPETLDLIQDLLSTDGHLQRIINDMEHTLRRIPTELRSVSQSDLDSLVPTRDKAIKEGSEKPSRTTIAARHSPPTMPLEQQTLSLRNTNAKIALTLQKHLEETCSKMEETSRQMEETCNQLRNDKEKLHEELEHKAKIIGSLQSNEEHYLKTIGNLRADLEQLNNKVSEQTKILTNLSTLSFQLTNENKVIPSLREVQAKLNTRLEEASRENERFHTQLQMMKLEREKFHILLTSKDNELEKFKLEVKSIQELVADQLTNMKNFVNHEKARDHLDNIIRVVSSHTQSLGFDTELESIVTDVSHEPSGGGEGGRGPYCSSPTSSMTSSLGIYPSWQVISRISSATNQETDIKSTSDIVLLGPNSRSLDHSKDFTSDINFDEAQLLKSSTPPAFASLQIYTILENNCENTPSRTSFKLEEVTSAKLVDITQTCKSSDVAKVKSSAKVMPDLSPGNEDISETLRLHKWFEEVKSLKWWNKDIELPDPPQPFDDVTEPEVNSQISEMSGDRFTLNSDLLSLSEIEDIGK
uniref:Uncharacterized protein n=1 Tax=Timema douglasi TaxID=61478 RepID=A0A7R8V942_TIMDO|nr:unnamed protein product [Timema douglasi]